MDWQEAAGDYQDGYEQAIRYTATATYTGTATSKYATGYTVTVDYKGEVSKTSCDMAPTGSTSRGGWTATARTTGWR